MPDASPPTTQTPDPTTPPDPINEITATTKNPWFSIYVPETKGPDGTTVIAQESYLRVGGANADVETKFLQALKSEYDITTGDHATEEAFGTTPSAGMVLYTKGDCVQFVNGRSDTRVLNDSHIVYALNKSDTNQTYRSYLRMGAPSVDLESALLKTSANELMAGGGVVLYSDKPIVVATPTGIKITTAADTRTVLGPTYAETYSVSDDDIKTISAGHSTVDQIAHKRLVTATLTSRDLGPLGGDMWRTNKIDLSKTLTFSLADTAAFGITSSYAFSAGLKVTNGIGASFDASVGVAVNAPSSFKVELAKKGVETSWSGGKIAYSDKVDLKGKSVTLSVNKLADVVTVTAHETLILVTRIGLIASNAAILAYTSTAAALGSQVTGKGDSSTTAVKDFMTAGLPVYATVTALNAALMVGGLILGLIQLVSKSVADATVLSPAQETKIVLNDEGIRIQAGTSYIEVQKSGIAISGAQVFIAGPFTNVLPAYLVAPLGPTGLAEIVQYIEDIASGETWET